MSELRGRPIFELRRDGNTQDEEPSVFPVSGLDRRTFVRVAGGIPAAAVLGTLWGQQPSPPGILRAHRGPISELFITKDGNGLVSGSGSENSKLWALPSGVSEGTFQSRLSGLHGNWLLLREKSKVLWVVGSAVRAATDPASAGDMIFLHGGSASSIVFLGASPDGNFAAASDGTKVFAGATDSLTRNAILLNPGPTEKNPLIALVVTDRLMDGKPRLVGSGKDGSIWAWTLPDGSGAQRFEIRSEALLLAAVPEHATIVSAHRDNTVNVVSLADGKLTKLVTTGAPVVSLLVYTDKYVIVGCADGTVKAASLHAEESLVDSKVELPSDVSLTAMALSPDEKLLSVGTSRGEILLLDWPTLNVRSFLYDPDLNDSSTTGLSYQVIDPLTGTILTYTLPCGSPIPLGATCLCNCVPAGNTRPPRIDVPTTTPGGTMTRPCNATPVPAGYICTCNCIPGR